MTRIIKFRGKRVDNGEWVYGYYVKDIHGHIIFGEPKEDTPIEVNRVDPKTVGQYTGMKDNTIWSNLTMKEKDKWQKNNGINSWKGEEIYEGDITIEKCEDYEFIRKVVWYEDRFVFESIKKTTMRVGIATQYTEVEVIGNIHENPELLK